jgi:hypothetical protein
MPSLSAFIGSAPHVRSVLLRLRHGSEANARVVSVPITRIGHVDLYGLTQELVTPVPVISEAEKSQAAPAVIAITGVTVFAVAVVTMATLAGFGHGHSGS